MIALLTSALPALAADLPAGFVRLADVDASIRQDMRYAGADNFLGRPAKGYEAPVCILTEQAAKSLSRVQRALAAEKLTLVVFDCYRPEQAVSDFVGWVEAGGAIDSRWSPKTRRSDLISKGYIGARSAHSRGSTVDLGIAPEDESSEPIAEPACGARGTKTIDFGTGFDCFDKKSETAFRPLPGNAAANRKRLVSAMRAAGFKNYRREWWHFTLSGEPFPKQRFDFPVTGK